MTDIIAFPPKSPNFEPIFKGADAAVDKAWDEVQGLLADLSYEDLVTFSNRSSERYFSASNHFINEIISDELGRRHQQMDPVNYPPEGAA